MSIFDMNPVFTDVLCGRKWKLECEIRVMGKVDAGCGDEGGALSELDRPVPGLRMLDDLILMCGTGREGVSLLPASFERNEPVEVMIDEHQDFVRRVEAVESCGVYHVCDGVGDWAKNPRRSRTRSGPDRGYRPSRVRSHTDSATHTGRMGLRRG